jgi:hypothetical protein
LMPCILRLFINENCKWRKCFHKPNII